MSIRYEQEQRIITLLTENSAYQMKIGPLGYLLHTYYGRRCTDSFGYLLQTRDCGGSPNPYELAADKRFSLDTMPQEYSGSNGGDYRLPSVLLRAENGVCGADLRYVRHEIRPGKYELAELPCALSDGEDAQTLSVTLRDAATGLEAELLYGVFERENVITRAVRFRNTGTQTLILDKAASSCLDLPFGSWDRIHFWGRHAMERRPERRPVANGVQSVSSERGSSGHQHNPFLILCEHGTGEDAGECYGLMLCYSGNFAMETELDQSGSLRVVSGIGERYFSWKLAPGELFETPELIQYYSDAGLTGLSRSCHRFIREKLCRSPWSRRKRPVLVNSWEAAYFEFDEEKIVRLAEASKKLGVEMLVLDDGWFGRRNSDNCALGDWFVNREKLPGGLGGLIRKVNDAGLKFGLWIEPEMISEDSELFRRHPDWALCVPGRKPTLGRNQLVLDLSRREIADWLYETMSGLLRENRIEYIKWDMNRCMTDLYSSALPPERQGELSHRYMLGLYGLISRLTEEFPEVLFEGCAGGGGRFDAGMLAYFPQFWCSDNTDPIARLLIQQGTSYGYPASAVGAHVSASPNHQTGRSTPIGTRATVAMAGTFGYELDPAKLSPDEKDEVRKQIARFHSVEDLVREGDYFRLTDTENPRYAAWQFVSADGARSFVSLVITDTEANARPFVLRLKGLTPDGRYRIAVADYYGCRFRTEPELPEDFSGAALMYGGLPIPLMFGDYPSAQIVLEAV